MINVGLDLNFASEVLFDFAKEAKIESEITCILLAEL